MEKENAETKTTKGPDQTITDKPSHKIPIKQKGKEMEKGPKEMAKVKESQDTATERLLGKTKRVNKTRKQNQ
jgi:hypothetical protein